MKYTSTFESFINESQFNNELNEKVDAAAYIKAGKLGYNDQFLGRKSLSFTLSTDLGLNPKDEFGGGDWLGFDHVSLYATGGKKSGTILDDALSGKYTYDELKAAAADFLGIKESVNEAVNPAAYVKAGKLGYNDQFLGRQSLSKTLSLDLGFDKKNEFGGGDWIGFDHVSMYATGKKGGTILDDALSGNYTYDELKSAAAKHFGI